MFSLNPQNPQYQGSLQIQSDCRSIEVKLVLNEPKQPNSDPLSNVAIAESEGQSKAIESSVDEAVESDDDSVGSKKPLRKRKSLRSGANNNDEELPTRDESPDTRERNELAKILFDSTEKRFKRNFDQEPFDSNECKLSVIVFDSAWKTL